MVKTFIIIVFGGFSFFFLNTWAKKKILIFFAAVTIFYKSINFDSYVDLLVFWQKMLAFDVSSLYNVGMPL